MYDSDRAKRNYQYYLSRGLCPKCGGKRKLVPNGKSCRECALKNSEVKRRMKERRIAEGRCTRCGGELTDTKYKTCEKCRAYIRTFEYAARSKRNKERYEHYKQEGICASCGRAWVDPGHAYCKDCRQKNAEHRAAYDPDGAKKRAFRQKRIDAGLCIDCGRPLDSGGQRCTRCLEMRNDSARKYKIHQRTLRKGLQWEQ